MRAVATIAGQVVRDAVRGRVLRGAALLAIGLFAASQIASGLTAGQDVKVVKDVALGAAHLFGLFVAVFLGIRLVAAEVERRSIETMLSKPVRRYEVILGKYAGLVATLAVTLLVMAGALYGVLGYLAWAGGPEVAAAGGRAAGDPALLKAVFLIFVQLALVAALALCLSTFSSPMLSAMATCGLYVAGHFSADLRNIHDVVDSRAAAYLAAGLSYGLPDLAAFDVKAAVVHAQPVTVGYIALTAGYGLLYIAALLVLASLIFTRRDLA